MLGSRIVRFASAVPSWNGTYNGAREASNRGGARPTLCEGAEEAR